MQAGLTIVRRDIDADVFEVDGDPAAVQRVIDRSGGEGRVVVLVDSSAM